MNILTVGENSVVVSVKNVKKGYSLSENEYEREAIEVDKLGFLYNSNDDSFSIVE